MARRVGGISPAHRVPGGHRHCLSGGGGSDHPSPPSLQEPSPRPPLPIANRVPPRMPTADSFVGMPFMRPTLRMHCPSTLHRHTITGGEAREES